MPSEVSLFNFYIQYRWKFTDFEDFQTWLFNALQGSMQGGFGTAAVQGLKVSCSALNVTASAGIAFNEDGRMLVLEEATAVAVASPAGNPARTLVVLRPVDTEEDEIPRPTNPSEMVPLHVARTAELVVIDGVPGAVPVYPDIEPGDVIVAGFLVSADAVAVTLANLEYYKRDVPRAAERRVRRTTATYTVDAGDDIVEVNTATVNLPAAPGPFAGKTWTFVNYRAADNAVSVSGNGTNVSGLAAQTIDDKWGTLSVYCNGVEYVVI